MRPVAGSDAFQPRSRKIPPAEPALPVVDARSSSPVTFVLRRERQEQEARLLAEEIRTQDASPVQDLAENTESTVQPTSTIAANHDANRAKEIPPRRETPVLRESPLFRRSPSSNGRAESPQQGSLTPLLIPSAISSQPSSPKSISARSLRPSEADSTSGEAGIQVMPSCADEQPRPGSSGPMPADAPQLIMPSIKIPSRRPFTNRGKQMGSFKIMITGGRGAGKTSLIKSIVQTCEDIVHVDPLSNSEVPSIRASAKVSRSPERSKRQRPHISEINASTRPFPSWRSEIEDSKILRRRISTGDTVLDRNLCFVDTGIQDDVTAMSNYMAMQLRKALRASTSASHDFAGLLSGSGGSQVDVIFYLLSRDTMDTDVTKMKALSEMSNVIPLISKADLLSTEELEALKTETRSKLDAAIHPNVPYLGAGDTQKEIKDISAPYTVSSAIGPDHETMDASLLMSPDYVQPLMPSDLALLVQTIFENDVMAYLRHSAAKKLVAWGASHPQCIQPANSLVPPFSTPPQPNSPASLLPSSLSNSAALVPFASDLSLAALSSNNEAAAAMTRLAENTQQEERLAQIRLSKWASDLQSSLQRERERFEMLAKSDRATWLVEKMSEESQDGRLLVPDKQTCGTAIPPVKASNHDISARPPAFPPHHHGRHHDPLDLLRISKVLQNRAWIAVQIVGGFGVLGGLAFWIAKMWGSSSSSAAAAAVGGTGGSNEWSPSWSWIRCC